MKFTLIMKDGSRHEIIASSKEEAIEAAREFKPELINLGKPSWKKFFGSDEVWAEVVRFNTLLNGMGEKRLVAEDGNWVSVNNNLCNDIWDGVSFQRRYKQYYKVRMDALDMLNQLCKIEPANILVLEKVEGLSPEFQYLVTQYRSLHRCVPSWF